MRRRLLTGIRTALALGPRNIARVLAYRLQLRAGIHPAQRLHSIARAPGEFFAPAATPSTLQAPEAFCYFGWHEGSLGGSPPDWHRNPFTDVRAPGTDRPWWTIPDFDPALGDIKGIWEASRFDWVMGLAQQARGGREGAAERLNAWIGDWYARNPPYLGHNWKCGQETSIRVLHLAVGALVLGQPAEASAALTSLLEAHLRRVAPTMAYAMGQDNNHGSSEAAALFIGGSWLESLGSSEGAAWQREGRRRLEDRVRRLIQPDGTTSQYSVNYHRLMLDTFGLAELWRRRMGAPPLSAGYGERVAAAAEWLRSIVDPVTGDAPNLGANDGANLLPLTGAGYRDYRPSVQLALALFLRRRAYADAPDASLHLAWLGVDEPNEPADPPASRVFDDGGYAVLHRGPVTAVLRYPRFRFRPSHADPLHLDLWRGGENLLRDAGSFSYNTDAGVQNYFTGIRGHNTVQFDGREPMPRLGRFLWGDWLKTDDQPVIQEDGGAMRVAASYRDSEGARHRRSIQVRDDKLTVSDEVSGFRRSAILRWRVRPGSWLLEGTTISDGRDSLRVTASVPMVRCELTSGWESRFYLRKTPAPVLEVELAAPGTLTTEYRWSR